MSKKARKTIKFNYKSTGTAPKLKKPQTTWNLKKHYYRSESDPQIEKDAQTAERAYRSFAKKFKNKNFTHSSHSLKQALNAYEELSGRHEMTKISRYFAFRTTLQTNDNVAIKKANLFAQRFKKLSNEIVFFTLELGKIPKARQRKFLADPKLAHYRYFLQQTFAWAKYQLTEPEEKIISLLSTTSNSMWQEATEKIIGNRQITYKKKRYSIPEALEYLDLLSWDEKQAFWNLILDEMLDISEFAEHELTALVSYAQVSDDARGFTKPYSATMLSYENDERSVEALIEAISTTGFALSRRFYKLKAQLHKRAYIPYVNKYDSIGDEPTLSFAAAVEICRDTFYEIKSEYGLIFDRLITEGQTDVYPRQGKRGGAFMAATTGLPTYVLLNHVSNFKSMSTLAHEMGHAVHAERSKQQKPLYEDFSTTTAETASTLFEQLVSQKLFKQLTNDQQIIFLHDKITRDIATVQRQVAFFNFELAMHQHIRTQGAATKEELAQLMVKHLKRYLGPKVTVSKKDGYMYVYIPHIRYGFYVFTYAYGALMSNLMAQKLHQDPKYIEKIDDFLCAGGSDSVENIFKSIGIDTSKTKTFTDSLKTQADEITLFEKLTHS